MVVQNLIASRVIAAILLLLVVIIAAACTSTVQPNAIASVDETATATQTPEPTPTRTPKPTATRTPKPTATRTRTPRPTSTVLPTATPTLTMTQEATSPPALPPTPEQLPSPALPPPAQTYATATSLPPAPAESEPPSEAVTVQIPDYVPILMYHYVRTVNEAEDPLGYGLSVTPELFEAQMVWLYENNYTPVRMDTLMACLEGRTRCPQKPVALTFDDGYEDAATIAMPIMKRYGFTGTFYIVTNFVGNPGYMSWQQLELMRDSGMEIGAHSVNHPDLTSLSYEEALKEITLSRATLQGKLDVDVESFCYPIGSYNLNTMTMVQEAGYTNAVTTYPGSSLESPYELPRRRILGGETLDAFIWYVTAFES